MNYIKIQNQTLNVQDILENLILTNDDIVFISGSLVEGIGNSTSDLDVFILTNDLKKHTDVVYTNQNSKMNFFKIGNINCDVEIWDINLIYSILDQLNSIDLENTEERVMNSLSYNDTPIESIFSLIHRFLTGKCIFNNEKFDDLYETINQQAYFTLLTRLYVNLIDLLYEDAIGNFKKKEYETSLIIINQIMIKALQVYLASNNISIDREKWAYIKMKKLCATNEDASQVLSEFKNLYFKVEDIGNLEIHCKKCIRFINKVVRKVNI